MLTKLPVRSLMHKIHAKYAMMKAERQTFRAKCEVGSKGHFMDELLKQFERHLEVERNLFAAHGQCLYE